MAYTEYDIPFAVELTSTGMSRPSTCPSGKARRGAPEVSRGKFTSMRQHRRVVGRPHSGKRSVASPVSVNRAGAEARA